jgi:HD-GYP domain-containing protein (c-di-GMP phosphodiesterase class II)
MLHDIGKCKLASELAPYCTIHMPKDPALLEAWQTHPRVSYEMVRRGIEPSASVAILHHHQHFDGTGFPAVMRKGARVIPTGHDIHVFARILHMANLFDHLTHKKPDAPPRPAIEVLHMLRTQYAGTIDPVVFTALQQAVPPFPLGGQVRLSDGREAIVTGLNAKDPYRPLVRCCINDRYTLEDKPLNLMADGAPTIKSVEGVSVEEFIPAAQPSAPPAEAPALCASEPHAA